MKINSKAKRSAWLFAKVRPPRPQSIVSAIRMNIKKNSVKEKIDFFKSILNIIFVANN